MGGLATTLGSAVILGASLVTGIIMVDGEFPQSLASNWGRLRSLDYLKLHLDRSSLRSRHAPHSFSTILHPLSDFHPLAYFRQNILKPPDESRSHTLSP